MDCSGKKASNYLNSYMQTQKMEEKRAENGMGGGGGV